MAADDLSAEVVRSVLDYEPETGMLRWKRRLSSRTQVGAPAGTRCNGYSKLALFGRQYYAHRLAWLHVYGAWPEGILDHINRNRSDNRISNLRDVGHAENGQNRAEQKNNTSGFKGVTWCEGRMVWRSDISIAGRQKFLGHFKDAAQAAYARAEAERVHFAALAKSS